MSVASTLPLLLVEDDPDMAGNISDYLERRGWIVHHARSGALALHLVTEQRYAAVILDRGIPGLNGVEVCRHLRRGQSRDLPVLMLTAADSLAERLEGFDAGADDYVVKPFALPELLARITALVRRTSGEREPGRELLRCADLEMDPRTREVRRGDRVLKLTNMAFAVLEILLRRTPEVVSRDEIEQALWADDPPGSDALRAHVFALRAAVDGPAEEPLVHTHRGVGYQICARASVVERDPRA
jgi:DNA-binding response OmpR family regulator